MTGKKHDDEICRKECASENMSVFTEIPALCHKVCQFKDYTCIYIFLNTTCV